MLHKSIATLSAIGVVCAMSACSPKDNKGNTAPASSTASTPATVTASAPVVVASAGTIQTASTVASTASDAPTVVTPAAAQQAANSSAPATTAAPNLALKEDLTKLFKTLNELDRNTQAKQAEMAKKMQNAKTPADQQAFFKEVVAQLDLQKATLNKLQFGDSRVAQTRDKMVESITNSRSGTAELIKKPNATPETNPEIAKSMETAQKSAEEARAMLMKLTEEAGIKPNAAPAASKK